MKHLIPIILTSFSLLCLVTQLYAGKIYVPDDHSAITLQDTEKYYYFPESAKTMPDTHHHMYIEGEHRICYQDEDLERDPDGMVIISIRDARADKEIIDWHCYEQ